MGYFADGMTVPDDGRFLVGRICHADKLVIELLAEDNWGNLVAVLPWGDNHTAGGGIYYHADCEHHRPIGRIELMTRCRRSTKLQVDQYRTPGQESVHPV
jgi:hypothetical protein